jgi:tetratricopeptide (TPR) repeat protein
MNNSLLDIKVTNILTYFNSRYQNKKNLIKLSTLLLLATFSVRTVLRNEVWRDEETLFRSGVAINPAKSWSNYANILSTTRGNKMDAELAFKQALLHRFNMADTHYNLGILLQEQQRYKEAVNFYKQAIRFRPGLGFAYLNLGLTLTELGDSKGAVAVFRKGVDVTDKGIKDPTDNIEARAASSLNLGRLLLEHGDRNGALTVLHQAVNKTSSTYMKKHGETGSGIREKLYNQLGEVYTSLGNTHEAEKWYQSSLNVNPRHVPAYLTLAKLVAKNVSIAFLVLDLKNF